MVMADPMRELEDKLGVVLSSGFSVREGAAHVISDIDMISRMVGTDERLIDVSPSIGVPAEKSLRRKVERTVIVMISKAKGFIKRLNEFVAVSEEVSRSFGDDTKANLASYVEKLKFSAAMVSADLTMNSQLVALSRSTDFKRFVFELRHIKDVLNEVSSFVESIEGIVSHNRDSALKEAEDAFKLKLDLDSELGLRLGRGATKRIILDAQFAKALSEEMKKHHKRVCEIKMPNAEFVITHQVDKEMRHRALGGLGAPLVPDRLRNYFTSRLGARLVELVPTDKEKNMTISNWWGSSKASSSSMHETERFLSNKSGDLSIIVFCLRNPHGQIVVLSDDNDIKNVVHNFQQHDDLLKNVTVFALHHGVLERRV